MVQLKSLCGLGLVGRSAKTIQAFCNGDPGSMKSEPMPLMICMGSGHL